MHAVGLPSALSSSSLLSMTSEQLAFRISLFSVEEVHYQLNNEITYIISRNDIYTHLIINIIFIIPTSCLCWWKMNSIWFTVSGMTVVLSQFLMQFTEFQSIIIIIIVAFSTLHPFLCMVYLHEAHACSCSNWNNCTILNGSFRFKTPTEHCEMRPPSVLCKTCFAIPSGQHLLDFFKDKNSTHVKLSVLWYGSYNLLLAWNKRIHWQHISAILRTWQICKPDFKWMSQKNNIVRQLPCHGFTKFRSSLIHWQFRL